MKNNKNLLKSVLSFALAIMVFLSITVMAGCSSSSAEAVAEKAAQAYVDGDSSAYYNLLAPGYVDYVVGSDGWYKTADEFKEDVIQDNIDELQKKFENRCGKNYSVEVSVVSVDTCKDDNVLENAKKELVRDYNYEDGDIQDINQVEVRFRCTGNDTGGDIYHTFNCVKEKGKWYIHRPDIETL